MAMLIWTTPDLGSVLSRVFITEFSPRTLRILAVMQMFGFWHIPISWAIEEKKLFDLPLPQVSDLLPTMGRVYNHQGPFWELPALIYSRNSGLTVSCILGLIMRKSITYSPNLFFLTNCRNGDKGVPFLCCALQNRSHFVQGATARCAVCSPSTVLSVQGANTVQTETGSDKSHSTLYCLRRLVLR